ncbi:hypothetical protein GLAREA_10664 [Glarea lozoyensis ATCC 20868]|uniref:Uncharacterized protein n=1 Tax=Glarea lozoyensis (strain ATCC 20868 / MF5171) TaxID=1116229 RepID=S3DCZ8_GLAL2|nr:uncharacterized protein GLAREA_10664 [Glarea lozoyensis ATCC 20868]EPE34969.1 hypothetical protein GLAREA_10664 [Glarea lozoyensis ATCC 20868]
MAATKTQHTMSTRFWKPSSPAPDPFAALRKPEFPPTVDAKGHLIAKDSSASPPASPASSSGRRYSGETGDEWGTQKRDVKEACFDIESLDASKTPPSRFQQRKGSIYATPNSRDGHVDRNHDRDHAYHEKLAEKGWGKKDRRGSKASI